MTNKIERRLFLQLGASAAALPALARIAHAETYPARPVRMIVPFASGGASEILARLIGQWLNERLGQPFVIELRPGAGGNLGTEVAVASAPDGYTLEMVNAAPSAINATLYDKLSFNFLRDMVPVGGVQRTPLVLLVYPGFPPRTVPELIAYAKANPGKINMASAGNGSPPHAAGELFKMMAGVDIVHVPYRGGGPALVDLLGGQVQIFFGVLASAIEYIKAGKLRALAVTTATPVEALPDVPMLNTYLPGYEASDWYGICAPKGTPAEIVNKLNVEINAGLADPNLKARFAQLGGSSLAGTPADFGKLIAEETEKWGKVVRAAHMKAE
jgi:tripartite-type tricarboxylate transporter receptor subunit TctC